MFMKSVYRQLDSCNFVFKLIVSCYLLFQFTETNGQSGGTPNTWQYVNSSNGSTPQGRHECSYVEVNGNLYLIGGRGTPNISIYNPATNAWTSGPKFPNNKEIHHFQGVKFNNKIYVIGAFTGGFPTETPVPEIYVFDPATNTWSTLAVQIPVGRRRGSVGVAVYNNKIYLVGGITNGHTNGWVNWMDEFDPVNLSFKTMPNAPHQRDHFHAVVFGDKLYVTGGRKSSYPTSTIGFTDPTVDVFDFTTQLWVTLPSSSNIPTPRAGTATVLLNNEIVLASGESGTNSYHKEVEAFNPVTNTWRTLPPMLTGRNAPGGEVYNNRFYVVTGVNFNEEVTSQEVYFTDPSPVISSPLPDIKVIKNTVSSQISLTNVFTDNEGISNLTYSIITNSSPSLITGATINQNTLQLTYAANQTGSGNIRIRATDSDGLYVEDEFKVDVIETPPPVSVIKLINSGGNNVNFGGQTWVADVNFSGGSGYTNNTAIAGTTNDAIYQTERYGNTFSYAIPLANGTYNVKLHFAELYFTSSNQRVFNVNIENGKGILTNYDIFSKAGAKAAKIEEFPSIILTDGTLNINFSSVTNNAKISAIEISSVVASCNAPTTGSSTGITSRSAVLNWNAVNEASSYRVEYKKVSDANWTLAATGITALTTTISSLDPGINYNWQVQEVCNSTGSNFYQSQFTTLMPVANAGNDQSINSNSTTLSGSGSIANGTITSYNWTQVSGPNTASFNNQDVQQPVINSLIEGTYVFSLIVRDNSGAPSIADNVTVTVTAAPVNNNPVADAGSNITVTLPTASINLNGSGNDDDGTISSYAWTQVSGPNTASFINASISNPQVDGLVEGTYIFSLIVTDDDLAASAADQVTVTANAATPVNQIPVANAGSKINITLPTSSTNLNGSGSDDDGIISSYAWTQVSGPNTASISNVTISNPQVSGLVQGTYVFNLIVTDDDLAASAADQVSVFVAAAPVAYTKYINAGGAAVNFNGQSWLADQNFSGGSTYSSSNSIGATTNDAVYQKERYGKNFSYAIPVPNGTYTLRLHFAEIYWSSSGQRVFNINVESGKAVRNNFDIYAKAGLNNAYVEQIEPLTITDGVLNIAFSTLSDNAKISGIEIVTYNGILPCGTPTSLSTNDITSASATVNWAAVAGANNYRLEYKMVSQTAWTIAGAAITSTNFSLTNLNSNTLYDWRVQANCTSGSGSVASGQFTTIIPVANAGTNKSITLPQSSVLLTGSGSVTVGSITGYSWSQISGPNTAIFNSLTVAQPTVSGLVAGTYVFSLIVTDNQGKTSAADLVNVVVTTAAIPVANAGTDKNITLPTSSTTLNGSGTAVSGIQTYSWSQVSGPNTAVFSNKTVAVPTVSGLVTGTYVFSLTITDNNNAVSAADQVNVEVSASAPPVANAGSNKSITLPTSSTTLNGSGTAASGIKTYTWTQSSGPNTPTFSSKTVAVPTVSNLIAGTYEFALVVTDNNDVVSAADQVNITVSPVPNGQQVVSLTLINASNETDIITLTNGIVLNLATLPSTSLNIRANSSPATVGRIVFVMTGTQSRNVTETAAPYALYGDNSGNYNAWTPATGQYTLTATPYTTSSGGVAGTPATITFTVVNQATRSMQIDTVSLRNIQSQTGGNTLSNGFELHALPNPSGSHFNIQIVLPVKEPAELIVMNISGQIVERRSGINSGSVIEIGSNYKPGMYVIHLVQKNQFRTLKIIKQ